MIRRRLLANYVLALSILSGGCFVSVPEVADDEFACVDDLPFDDGLLQCPQSHWCYEGSCKPRFGCSKPDADKAECELFVERCELSLTGTVSAVSCESGVHTVTSTRPSEPDTCDCPDGTACVIFAEASGQSEQDAFELYLASTAGNFTLPASFGSSERPGTRVCARGCSGELDCPAGHTCRPASVYSTDAPSDFTDRNTISVCYPDNVITLTATTAEFPELPKEPIENVCRSQADCQNRNVTFDICQVRVAVIPDHPKNPAGERAWGEHFALISTCVQPISSGLTNVDKGCDTGSDCESGICHNGRCARLCDSRLFEPCPGGRSCTDTQVSRPIKGEERKVRDRVWLCEGF
ncbi:MAG: hypothetical protein VYC39_16970 [Myxococcota bacterium]|nr:hypothetical protein [Myxococcota bacterium]